MNTDLIKRLREYSAGYTTQFMSDVQAAADALEAWNQAVCPPLEAGESQSVYTNEIGETEVVEPITWMVADALEVGKQAQAGAPEVVAIAGGTGSVTPTLYGCDTLFVGDELITLQAHREAMAKLEKANTQLFEQGQKMYARIAKKDAALKACVEASMMGGTFACPICGNETVHGHGLIDVIAWGRAQMLRFIPNIDDVAVVKVRPEVLPDFKAVEMTPQEIEELVRKHRCPASVGEPLVMAAMAFANTKARSSLLASQHNIGEKT